LGGDLIGNIAHLRRDLGFDSISHSSKLWDRGNELFEFNMPSRDMKVKEQVQPQPQPHRCRDSFLNLGKSLFNPNSEDTKKRNGKGELKRGEFKSSRRIESFSRAKLQGGG
jgi:hypothetical protein